MLIVYGMRHWGRADVIDGVGHVSVRFFHIMFVPLVPVQTTFMLPGDRGVKLPFSFKAVMSGWLRGAALVAGISNVIGGLANLGQDVPTAIVCFIVAAIALGSFPIWGLIFGHCSGTRRAELMSMLGIRDQPGGSPATPIRPNWQPPTQQAPQYPQQPQYPQYPQQQPQYGQYGAPPAGGFGGYPQPGYAPQQGYPQQQQQQAYPQPPQGYAPPPQGWDPNHR